MVLSQQQEAIHEEFRTGTGHVVVVARAGVGKTTTAITGVKHAPEQKILFTCFNVRIAAEGNRKLAELGIKNARYQTLHSVGAAAMNLYWEGLRVCENFERETNLTNAVCNGTVPDPIKRLVGKLHSKGREIVPHATSASDLMDLAEEFELVPDAQWEEAGYDANYVCAKAVAAMRIAADKKPADGLVDFSDMIFLPVRNGWLTKSYDLVIVDEAQDLTVAKLELAQGVCKGRMFIIGDDMQAIYAFCGADVHSLSRLKGVLSAKELKLTKTFRCGKAIVREAQKLVPDFEAADSNHEGSVEYLDLEKLVETAGPSDFILSRLNAPLVSIAMRLLRAGKRTRIAGRDIGKGLVNLVRKMRARSVPDLLRAIEGWKGKELSRLKAKYTGKEDSPVYGNRVAAIEDQALMLSSVTEGCKNVIQVTERIESLFTDNGLGDKDVITLSSVHKSKGLEAPRVFVLTDTLKSHNQEENNIRYVAITRAINTLVYVSGSVVR